MKIIGDLAVENGEWVKVTMNDGAIMQGAISDIESDCFRVMSYGRSTKVMLTTVRTIEKP